MAELNKEQITNDVIKILNDMSADWELDDDITKETKLSNDLGFESIDAVVFSTTVEEYYGKSLPFAQYIMEIGDEGKVRNLSVGDLIDFVYDHLNASEQ
ncbi:hypothetical protein GF312_06060 [Candidatus Poribacteria bacterium]|nr:hypothetical protein [Candidatus Poribacteria bacterium]